jgi:hypothetical protein
MLRRSVIDGTLNPSNGAQAPFLLWKILNPEAVYFSLV